MRWGARAGREAIAQWIFWTFELLLEDRKVPIQFDLGFQAPQLWPPWKSAGDFEIFNRVAL